MKYKQLRQPNVGVYAEPGMCLNYVQRAFGSGWSGATATDGWSRVKFRHADADFPTGVAVPVWFSLADNPAGHVVVRMGDGSIWSASDNDLDPDFHPNLAHLLSYYTPRGAAKSRLSLRGWSEDLGDLKVVESIKEEPMPKTTTEAVVALAMATTGRLPADAVETQFVGAEATQANLDGLVTQWASKSRIPALEARLRELEQLVAKQGFVPLGQEVFVPRAK